MTSIVWEILCVRICCASYYYFGYIMHMISQTVIINHLYNCGMILAKSLVKYV